jgi:hypothetical protein
LLRGKSVLPFISQESRAPGASNRLAISDLERYEPEFSARTVITSGQVATFGTIAAALALAFAVAPGMTSTALSDTLAGWFLANASFRGLLLLAGARVPRRAEPPPLGERDLPVYSILVPLYHEAEVLPVLVRALSALDYPHECLDIKLIVEVDDEETRAALDAITLDACFEVVVVPHGEPRTKPRACNHALESARGDLLVIYDAEDRPEPDQLQKAASLFSTSPRDIACLQARLNFYNARENILTRGIMAQTPQAGYAGI